MYGALLAAYGEVTISFFPLFFKHALQAFAWRYESIYISYVVHKHERQRVGVEDSMAATVVLMTTRGGHLQAGPATLLWSSSSSKMEGNVTLVSET